jgi:hypothetical protein
MKPVSVGQNMRMRLVTEFTGHSLLHLSFTWHEIPLKCRDRSINLKLDALILINLSSHQYNFVTACVSAK